MTSLTSSYASEAGHWYHLDGRPCYTVIGKNGKERPTTLADARKLNLVPSVTGIIKMAAAPGLERWKQQQMMMAALTLPRTAEESELDWLKRVWIDAGEHARQAAERGTAIHAAIQSYYEGMALEPAWEQHVIGAAQAIMDIPMLSGPDWKAEKSFAHPLGFGGKTDLHSAYDGHGMVLDVKTKEFSDTAELAVYDEHAMQLAAYREGLGMNGASAGIVYVSTSVPGLAHIIMLSRDELVRGWSMFQCLLQFWKAKNRVL